MIEMPRSVTSTKRVANYSNCPLKKRPIKYDPEEDSDSDISNKGCSPKPLNCISEPENLSTKPEDLRLTMKDSPPQVVSPPPIAIVAGREEIPSPSSSTSSSPSSPTYSNHYGSPYVSSSHPTYLPVPPPLKTISNGPLEPISLNPPAMWPRVTPFMPFNYPAQNTVSSRGEYYVGGVSPSYPRTSATTQLSSHYAPFISRESGSPPHVSPPLKTEPSYPTAIKYEEHPHHLPPHHHQQQHHQQQQRTRMLVSPSEIMTVVHHHPHPRMVDDLSLSPHHHHHHHHSSAVQQPQAVKAMKKESSCYYPSSTQSHCSSSSSSSSGVNRDSVISHVNHCSSGASPASSHSPPIAPTNVNGSVRYHCPDCNKSYSTFSGLSKHLQFHCASQNKKSFICKHCQKVYVSLGALKMHIRTHTLPCKCTLCGKAFSRPWLLQGHIRTHTGEKPFACQHCNRAFADRSNLRAHLQTHSEVKKYSCKSCSKHSPECLFWSNMKTVVACHLPSPTRKSEKKSHNFLNCPMCSLQSCPPMVE